MALWYNSYLCIILDNAGVGRRNLDTHLFVMKGGVVHVLQVRAAAVVHVEAGVSCSLHGWESGRCLPFRCSSAMGLDTACGAEP